MYHPRLTERAQTRELQAQRVQVRLGRQDRHPTIRRCRPLPCQCRPLPYLEPTMSAATGQRSALRCRPSLPTRAGATTRQREDHAPMRLHTPCSATARMHRRATFPSRRHHSLLPALPAGRSPRSAPRPPAAALAHLARHARTEMRAAYLRICQCQERGCRWHAHHRGCVGPIRLLLARDCGGLVWRLTDACTPCAAATEQAAVAPDTKLLSSHQPRRAAPRHRRLARGPGDRVRVADLLVAEKIARHRPTKARGSHRPPPVGSGQVRSQAGQPVGSRSQR